MSEHNAGPKPVAYSKLWTVVETLSGDKKRPLLPQSVDRALLKPSLMIERVLQINDQNHASLLQRSMNAEQFERTVKLSHLAGVVSRVTQGMSMFRPTAAYEQARATAGNNPAKLEEMRRRYMLYCAREAGGLTETIGEQARDLYVVMDVAGHAEKVAAKLKGVDIVTVPALREPTPELLMSGHNSPTGMQPKGMQTVSLWQEAAVQPL